MAALNIAVMEMIKEREGAIRLSLPPGNIQTIALNNFLWIKGRRGWVEREREREREREGK